MTSRSSTTKRRAAPSTHRSLDRNAWLAAAADAIADDGFGAARILTLAKRLGVTRGSFYWHFHNHDEFIRAFLARWRGDELEALATWRPATGHGATDLRRAVHRLLSGMARDAKALRVELAVQDFARRNALAAAITLEVNRARMKQGVALFEALTGERARARELTLLLYASITGARLMLAASPRSEKTDAIAARLEHVIGDAIISPNADQPRHNPKELR